MKVLLKDVVEALEVQFDFVQAYVNVESGKVVEVTQENLQKAEELDEGEELPEWLEEELAEAIDIIEHYEKYIPLPDREDINEYEMMKNFSHILENEKQSKELLRAIKGKGAFQRFKDTVANLGLSEQWYAYRQQQYKEVARQFCVDNGLDYQW